MERYSITAEMDEVDWKRAMRWKVIGKMVVMEDRAEFSVGAEMMK